MQKSKLLLYSVLILALIIAAGCSLFPTDKSLATDIKAKMFSDPDLKGANIEVAVKDGEVTLAGEVSSAEVQLKAFKLVNATPGVKKVIDQMKVAGAQVAESQAPAQASPEAPAATGNSANPSPQAGGSPAVPSAGTPAVESAKASPGSEPPPKAVPAPQPVKYVVPAGTRMSIRMVDSIDSSEHQAGQVFRASTDLPISEKGHVVVPKNTPVFVKLANAKSAGHFTGSSELELQLYKMELHGETYPLMSNSYQSKGESRGTQTAKRVGIGAAAGTVIGAIAGGGKGAAIGATVGGGTATGVQLATRGKQVKVPSETQLDFTLQSPVTVTVLPKSNSPR